MISGRRRHAPAHFTASNRSDSSPLLGCIARSLALGLLLVSAVPPAPVLAQNWIDLSPAAGPAPAPRAYASAVYDPAGHRMIVFAGETASGRVNDIWAFDLTTNSWTNLTPAAGAAPGARRTPGSVLLADGPRMVTWSGQGGSFFNDAWSFDLTSNTWTQLSPAVLPNPRYGVAVVLDPATQELVTFAGFTNLGRFFDTWRLNPTLQSWTETTPAVHPGERCLHSASYDSRGHRYILYGGQRNGPLDDVWALDLATDTWAELTPAARPIGRFHASHVYDARNHRSTIFGGSRGALGGVSDEVWLFDLWTNTFTQMFPSGTGPTPREGSPAIYVQAEDRMVIFGGFDGSYHNQIWSLEHLSQTLTSSPPGRPSLATALHQNRPNPFNPTTVIPFELSQDGPATLEVFDIAGRRVTTLLNGHLPQGPGSVTWNGLDAHGHALPSGAYYYRLLADGQAFTRTMLLVQ